MRWSRMDSLTKWSDHLLEVGVCQTDFSLIRICLDTSGTLGFEQAKKFVPISIRFSNHRKYQN